MLKLVIALLCVTVAASQLIPRPPGVPSRFLPLRPTLQPLFDVRTRVGGPYRLCTYSNEEFTKCIHTGHVAENNSIPLALECVQKDRLDNCLHSVHEGSTDMVVLAGHDYKDARRRGLKPIVFGREDDSSFYIAVAPRNLTVLELQEAPIDVNQSDQRALDAAIFFNLQRGHDICDFAAASSGPYIKIVDSATYTPNDDEILICPNRFPGEFGDHEECNVEASLQRAVFVRSSVTIQEIANIRRVFDTILARFGPNSPPSEVENGKTLKFFATFLDRDDLIFKNNTVAFDLQPTYRNAVDEALFSYLHCNNET